MAKGYVAPTLGLDSFSCPSCNALAHQTWYFAGAQKCDQDKKPWVPRDDVLQMIENDASIASDKKKTLSEYYEKILSKKPFQKDDEDSSYFRRVYNLSFTKCYSCRAIAVWQYDKIVIPEQGFEIQLNSDCPGAILPDLEEARDVLKMSARSAAALLRLALQKLLKELGEPGKNINDDIGSLVKKGLDKRIQKALDVVRVIGNNAVHPGHIDLKDDNETVVELFRIIDFIINAMITQQKKIDEIFDSLPTRTKEAIEKRDAVASS